METVSCHLLRSRFVITRTGCPTSRIITSSFETSLLPRSPLTLNSATGSRRGTRRIGWLSRTYPASLGCQIRSGQMLSRSSSPTASTSCCTPIVPALILKSCLCQTPSDSAQPGQLCTTSGWTRSTHPRGSGRSFPASFVAIGPSSCLQV